MSRRMEILDILSGIVALPSCASKAFSLLADSGDVLSLARVIERDPGLTANLLKLENASAPGGQPVLTARDVLSRLGDADVLQFVVSTGVAHVYTRTIDGYDQSPGEYLQQSVAVALAACKVGEALGIPYPDYTYTAGLLSGVGKLALGTFAHIDMAALLSAAQEGELSFDRAEDAVLGINHAEAGALLLEQWGLPEALTHVVRHHLRPDEYAGESRVLDLVHVGTMLASMAGVGLGVDGLNYDLSPKVVDRLGVTAKVADTVEVEVITELAELGDHLLDCVDRVCVL